MPTQKDYPAILQAIKNKLEAHKMSTLVGAGFSKNFNNDIFPSWWQLLRDMVNETQGQAIKERFNGLVKGKGRNRLKYENYLNENLDKYIDGIGPLKAVSEYIVKKGYREAADFRIEEATPVVIIEKHKRFISYRENSKVIKREILPSEMLVHEKFVALPWNNIYTTNYDNLLETSIDLNIKKAFDIQVEVLQLDLEKAITDLNSIRTEIGEMQAMLNLHTSSDLPDSEASELSQEVAGVDPIDLNKLNSELNNKKWRKKGLKSSIDSINHDLRKFAGLQDDFNSLVRHSADLAIKKNGNIIKIHGSVRTAEYNSYGFDGDIRKHYVISQEDFDTYPQKHEAFTQLMRIALLQESFCIVGFSGIDPNFLAWIDWVRDVLERKGDKGAPEDKIYLIGIDDYPTVPDRELFYTNHGIIIIQLRQNECLNFLQEQTGQKLPDKATNKQLIELFIDFLSLDTTPNRFRAAFELLQQQKYKALIRSLPNAFNADKAPEKNTEILSKVDEISLLKVHNRVPDFRWDKMRSGYHYIRMAENFLTGLKGKELMSYLEVLLCFIDDQLIPLSILFFDTGETLNLLKKTAAKVSVELQESFQLLELKEAVLNNNKKAIKKLSTSLAKSNRIQITQEVIFQNALYAFYNFDFSQLENIIQAWNVEEHWILKKAGLIALSRPAMALDLLKGYKPAQLSEQLYKYERMTQFSTGEYGSNRIKYRAKVKELEEVGFATSTENVRVVIEDLIKEKKVIDPYGHGKNTISYTTTFGDSSAFLDSIQLFNYMNEVGFPISLPGVNHFEQAQLHKPFESLFEEYPFPILSLLCQFGNDKLTQRLAQDYIYSQKLFPQYKALSISIQKGCIEEKIPYRFKKQLLIFYSELLNVIAIEDWENFFIQIWKKEKHDGYLFSDSRIDRNAFIKNGLRYISKSSTQLMVINDCVEALDKVETHNRDTVIQHLYDLAANKKREKHCEANLLHVNEQHLKKIINRLPESPDLLFVLGNIDYVIGEDLRKEILSAIKSMRFFPNASERVWRIYFYYLEGDTSAKTALKKQLLKSKGLWDAGFIDENTTTSANNYISLYRLRASVDWSKEEAKIIFERMVIELEKIEKQLVRREDSHNYKSILEEMTWFMQYEKAKIDKLKSYPAVLKRINKLYIKQREYKDLMQGLISKDKSSVIWAVNELSYRLHNLGKISDQDEYLRLLVNKLIMKSPGGLAAAFGSFSDWLIYFRHDDYLKSLRNLIEKVIEVYCEESDKEFDAPFLEEKLIQMAYVLNRWGSKMPEVQALLDLLKNSRFNSTKHHLKYIIDNLDAEKAL